MDHTRALGDVRVSGEGSTGAGARPRTIRVQFRDEGWGSGGGLSAHDPRVRTLRRVLVSYPDVRHILPDRILDTIAQFLQRQQWLVRRVECA